MNEKDLKKYMNENQKLRDEIISIHEYIQEHPEDYAAVQTQLTKKIEELQNIR